MRVLRSARSTIAMTLAVALATAAVPAAAAPLAAGAAQFQSAAPSSVEQVRWRGHRGGGVAAGIAAGMLLGGLIASSPYYYGGPRYYYGPPGYYPPGYYGPIYRHYGPADWEAYCFSRYRSFDPYTGTYLGYDGRRHPCR
jgi:hypothetical protein